MEDFGGFEAGDAWEADEAEPVDPDAFPCFVNPVAGFTPRAEVEARAAERFADAEPEDEEMRAPVHPSTSTSTPSLPAAVTRLARRGDPRAPPRPDAAQRHAADPALPPPAVAGHRRGGGHFTFTKKKKARGPLSRAGASGGGGGPRTYRRGVERFCAVLLRWSVRALAEHEHDPNAVGLPPLPEPVTRFESPEHYFDVQRAVATEEARAALARASARFFFYSETRAFTETRGTSASSASSLKNTSTTSTSSTKRRHGTRVRLRAAPSEAGGADRSETGVLAAEAFAAREEKEVEKTEWRRPGTVLALRRVRADGAEDEPELAIVTGSRAGAGLGVPQSDATATTVPLWMASSSRMFREPFREPTGDERNDRRDRLAVVPDSAPFVTAELYVLDTVVSQMRIAAAAHTRPSPPFLHELLGSRRAGAHVRFASDDDDEELGDEELGDEELARDRRSVLDEAKRKKHEARLATERAHHESLAFGTPLASLNDAQRRAGCLFAEGVLETKRFDETVSTAREENAAAAEDAAEVRDVDSDETHLEADDDDRDEDEDDVGRFDATAAFSSRSRRLHLVQGPPGCGKTKFVAATLRALVERPTFPEKRKRKRSFRVLLCAPSNKAVTVALERFLATIATIGPEASRRPFPLLVGVEEALELACAKDEGDENENENEGSETTTTNAASTRRVATRNRVMDFFVHRRCGVLADRLAASAERLLETHVSYASHETRSSDARSVLAAIRATLEELERLAPAFLAADGFRAKLNGAEATTNKWLAEATDATTTDALESSTVSPETQSLFRARLIETCAMLREGSGKGSRADVFAEQAVLRSDVVFATLSSSGQAILSRADNFDALIVDEAAQALECELVVALARKPKRCLLVGDPAQLPATMASDAARRQGHDRSCMRRLLDAAAEDASRASHASHDSWYTLLDTQYRMHPAISSFPSRRFYESSVRDAGSTQTVPFFLLPERVSTREKASRKNRARLERTGRVRRGDDDDDANARVTKEKKREALRSWLRAPFAFVDAPFAAGSRSETRGSSFARGGANNEQQTASLGNDAEAELAAALARALPWAMGGANDTTRRDAHERSSSAASSVSSIADSDSSDSDSSDSSFPDSRSDDATRRVDDVAPAATRITSAVITFYSEQVRRLRRELQDCGSLANALAGPHESGSVPRRAKETKATFSAKRRKTHATPNKSREDHFRPRDSSRFPPPAVHTVDSFQGSEADVVVISAVRCNARGDVGFLADPRRLNVALTRAKSVCVFVGCVRTLRASGSADLRALVRDSESRGLIATEAEARAWLELHK